MGAVYAVGEVARRFGYADNFVHKIILSDFTHMYKAPPAFALSAQLAAMPMNAAKLWLQRHKAFRTPDIPQEAFLAVLKVGEDGN